MGALPLVNPIEFVKSHPYATGAGIFIVGAFFLLSRSGNGASGTQDLGVPLTTLGPSAASIQSGNELQMASINASAMGHTTDVQAMVASKQIDAALQVATLNAANTAAQIKYNYNEDYYKNQSDATSRDLISNLTAKVQLAGIQEKLDEVKSNNASTYSIAQLQEQLAEKQLALNANPDITAQLDTFRKSIAESLLPSSSNIITDLKARGYNANSGFNFQLNQAILSELGYHQGDTGAPGPSGEATGFLETAGVQARNIYESVRKFFQPSYSLAQEPIPKYA